MELEGLRLAIYDELARIGRAPSVAELAERFAVPGPEVRDRLHALAAARHVVLDGNNVVLMARPFETIPLAFAVMGRSTLWWGGCAWDSFAMPAVLDDEPEVLIATRCPGCGRPLAWVVGSDGPRLATRSPTSWCPSSGSGTTSSTRAPTSGFSVDPAASTSSCRRRATSAAM